MGQRLERIRQLALEAMDELYGAQKAAGFLNTCCYDFGVPAVLPRMLVLESEVQDQQATRIAALESELAIAKQIVTKHRELVDQLRKENAELRQRAEMAEAVVAAAREMRSVGVVKCMCADPSRLEACGAAEKKFKAALAASEGGG